MITAKEIRARAANRQARRRRQQLFQKHFAAAGEVRSAPSLHAVNTMGNMLALRAAQGGR